MTDPSPTATGLYTHAELAPGLVLADRFRIEGLVGVGGMGVVYRAFDQALQVVVALKLLRPELAHRPEAFERFRQELLLARQVSSPHVVRIHDIAQHDGRWLISMDYVDGEPLDRRLGRERRLPLEDALRIARQIAEGLAAAHARGVVHRDLKPANVLLDREGNAYISDFGVARSLVTSGLTQSGTVLGTPDYLSPEQARGEPVDARSDLYALGLILYEMLAGTPPFAGGTMAEILGQRMVSTPKPVTVHRPDVPPWLARLVDRLLRPQPAHRFASAAEVIRALDTREVPREFRIGRRTWLRLAAVALGGALLGGGAWWWSQRQAAPATPPLQRLLVMPVDMPAAGGGYGLALAELLREGLADAGVVVVDGERTLQAVHQLDPTGVSPPPAEAVARLARADRTLQLRLRRETAGWRLEASLQTAAGDAPVRVLDAPAAADPAGATAAALPRLAALLALKPDALRPELPPASALQAFDAALQARVRDRLPVALERLRQATAAAPDSPRLWLALAATADAIGEDEQAYAALEQAQRHALRAPERLRRRIEAARALHEGDAAAAVAIWRALSAAAPDDTEASLQLARALGADGRLDDALDTLRALAERDDGDPRVWFELGKFSILQGDARRAVDDYLLRALVLFKRSRDVYGEAETVNALGVGYGRLGQTADAEEQYRRAVELREKVGNRRGLATSLRNLAAVLGLRRQFEPAARRLQQARALYESIGDRAGLAAVDNEIGLLAEERGDFAAALEAYRRALQGLQQVGDAHGVAETLNHIGFAHYQLGAYDNAQAFWQQAAGAYARLGDRTGDVRTAQNLALLDIARGRWSEAATRLERSLRSAGQAQMLEEIAVSRRNLAELALWQGRLGEALDHAGKARTLFHSRQDARGETDARLLQAQALLAAHADARAAAELDALAPLLAQAASEQQAIAAGARATLHLRAARPREAERELALARRLAQASGVPQLQVQIDLLTGGADLDARTAALGHVGLRLLWLEQALERALRDDPAAAVRHYREAQGLLRGKRYVRAFRLHALGAQALARAGDATAAARARESAASALRELRATIPASLQAGFDAAAEVRALTLAQPLSRVRGNATRDMPRAPLPLAGRRGALASHRLARGRASAALRRAGEGWG
ncbi:MAG: protein kinase domain-containing protein [Pseudomonadota bacterium]